MSDKHTEAGKRLGLMYRGMLSVGVSPSEAQIIAAMVTSFASQQSARGDALSELLKKVVKVDKAQADGKEEEDR